MKKDPLMTEATAEPSRCVGDCGDEAISLIPQLPTENFERN